MLTGVNPTLLSRSWTTFKCFSLKMHLLFVFVPRTKVHLIITGWLLLCFSFENVKDLKLAAYFYSETSTSGSLISFKLENVAQLTFASENCFEHCPHVKKINLKNVNIKVKTLFSKVESLNGSKPFHFVVFWSKQCYKFWKKEFRKKLADARNNLTDVHLIQFFKK